jgi:hypothetical protein
VFGRFVDAVEKPFCLRLGVTDGEWAAEALALRLSSGLFRPARALEDRQQLVVALVTRVLEERPSMRVISYSPLHGRVHVDVSSTVN